MAVSTIVAIIGLSAITVAQAKLKRSQSEGDVYAARLLALSAVENAMSDINSNGSWRSTYVNNVEYPATPIALNGGTITCKVIDPDGDLTDDTSDGATLYGIGRVGDAVHVHRVAIEVSGSDMKITLSTWQDDDAP
jgi:hypothetical protein